ncbi:uncharacterized protein K02A2.6-like [Oncorhynchus mykiss]|uniref:uncharacterized protein K02A2.6-like n=1 Tax=Oncorhynchus mykiss TaxID=8022 RepID=UPI001877DFDA|nr:uncharacterized protein K02A2.6-like [Oncorhynchus mykiss]
MELDTGSALSIISTTVYIEHFKATKLKNTNVLLKTYSGERLSPMRALQVGVRYGGQTQQLQLYVVPGTGPPLFGREWLSKIKLNWCNLKMLHTFQSKEKSTYQTLEHLRKKYNTVFSDQMGTVKGFTAKLVLRDDATPKFCKAISVPYSLRPKVEAEIDRLQDTGILTKVDRSEWATPIVPIVKKDGSVRMCGDFNVTVNSMLYVDQYSLPRLDDIFAALAGGKHFSKIDLKQAYLQLPVEESSKQYLTINTHKGLYRYNRLVFGIASAPAIWQQTIDQILQGIQGTQCILDDLIITGHIDKEHLANLEEVLKRLNECGLQANLQKCEFFKDKIVFCGHEIDRNGLHKTQDKIEAVFMPIPNGQRCFAFLHLSSDDRVSQNNVCALRIAAATERWRLSGLETKAMYIEDSLAAGGIRPSASSAGSGFFSVKKDKTLHQWNNYWGLNEIIVKKCYTLPLLTLAFEPLQEATIFSKLDLRKTYHLLQIWDGETNCNMSSGKDKYLVMPFELTNAPAVFQDVVNDILFDMLNQFVIIYLDDILVFSRLAQEHVLYV